MWRRFARKTARIRACGCAKPGAPLYYYPPGSSRAATVLCGAGWHPAADPKWVPRHPACRWVSRRRGPENPFAACRHVGQVFNLRPVSNRPSASARHCRIGGMASRHPTQHRRIHFQSHTPRAGRSPGGAGQRSAALGRRADPPSPGSPVAAVPPAARVCQTGISRFMPRRPEQSTLYQDPPPQVAGNPIYCHLEFLEKLGANHSNTVGRRAALLLHRLHVNPARPYYKPTQGGIEDKLGLDPSSATPGLPPKPAQTTPEPATASPQTAKPPPSEAASNQKVSSILPELG